MSRMKDRLAVAALSVFVPVAASAASSITLQYLAYTTPAGVPGTVTLNSGQSLNLETGAAVSSGGDLAWNGSTLTPVGKALAADLATLLGSAYSGSTGFGNVNQLLLQEGLAAGLGSSKAITPAQGDVIGLEDNSGNVGKLLVTSLSGGGPPSPTITGVQNNYSYIVPGLPNYGIAPGTLFIITGNNLASATSVSALQSSAAPGIPLTLNGASISVTVNGTTTHPAMYYAIASQIAAVLPSSTPVGTGTITVTYNGTASNAATITVVQTALGLNTYYGSGSGLALANDPTSGAIFTYTNSVIPGKTIVMYGSGLGADTADSDTVFTSTPHAVSTPLTIYIGGVQATVQYAGSSGYPGYNQINVLVPASVPTGCGVSVVGVSGNIVTNTVALPIGAAGGVCTDPLLGYNGTQLTSMTTNSAGYSSGALEIIQTTSSSNGLQTIAGGDFYSYPPVTTTTTVVPSATSLGSCFISISSLTGTTTTVTTTSPTGLDAGNITISGPGGSQALTNEVIPTQTGPSGVYYAQPANSFFGNGGTFMFTGSGGKNVGAFSTSISYTSPLVWTNMSSIPSVARASGQNITWTGGASGSYVYIGGTSSSSTASASFTCYAPASAGQFTVPSYVLLALPAGNNGSLGITNITTPVSFSASGLTNGGTVIAGVSDSINTTYN